MPGVLSSHDCRERDALPGNVDRHCETWDDRGARLPVELKRPVFGGACDLIHPISPLLRSRHGVERIT